MRRFLRILFSTATGLSLGLALLVAGLWVRTSKWIDVVSCGTSSWSVGVESSKSLLVFSVYRSSKHRMASNGFEHDSVLAGNTGENLLVGLDRHTMGNIKMTSLTVPDWLLAVGFATLPTARLIVLRRPKREGLCPTCNYDLRASPDRCPECGRATPAISEPKRAVGRVSDPPF